MSGIFDLYWRWVVPVKNTEVTDEVITHDKTEYASHSLTEVVDGKTGISESWPQDPVLVSNGFTKIDKRKRRIKDNN